ncbi:hypothetical protein [Gordonia rubripertincta]|uniref:MarR family transcriptional regulator n=1 Tax=Gordonia rubripertincta TaxID=36822 RepID=A0ABT4N280_GORRU|nr:hypothetical protein [Gordonia rubripertincta]MCZ4553385.1 hypothetical protein [Gordonia rubripertincta]
MTTSDLTGTEMIVLLVLMAEARGLTNAEIKERGPELRATPSRKKLNELGLIESDTSARPHRHALSDRGWARCNELLGTNPPAGTTPQGKALFTVLAGLGRHLHSNDLRLADVFSPPQDPVVPAETTEPLADDTTRIDPAVDVRIIEAYRSLAVKPGAWVSLRRLRPVLGDIQRDVLDDALRSLYTRPGITLIPEENQKSLTPEDRAAAVSIGGQNKHLIYVETV